MASMSLRLSRRQEYWCIVCLDTFSVCTGENFMENFGKELKTFLLELLRSIEADVRLDAKLFSKIKGMIEELILVHFDYLHNQRKSLERLPNSTVCVISLGCHISKV